MTLPTAYFDEMYRHSDDPWDFRARPYERRKRDVTLACLPEMHYSTAFEPGCSIGVLTHDLAARCDRLVSMDISDLALTTAARNVPENVALRQGSVPDDWPPEPFQLVVLSEVAYYLSDADCRRVGELAANGAVDLLVVHWRRPVDGYPLSGDAVHEIIGETSSGAGMRQLVDHREADFRLDVWSHDGRSVASRTGVPYET